ncbi:hypothetical protein A3D81_01875 [Candidatus Curtissbacteria bacterium RIFCSPHIGHO2_02_FULL_40_17]|uniref:Uncharacterized protein n=2 Tax=Candidatus Curtissiibacteriota TaxID=1752717 RepID=A0A1F5GG93_9BACT|nr:MAG: hypothetical protein A2693_02315 [Candidatus Curtissbacteria bacterium RIFCSPHIGHO2_01_FULL_40_12]OGD90866.1 MAG: hypothetical protein A3D81_01875 [Candidatus Curtissbacteria bacterium RIFCSPHIGHO2_02_FULL_40_17]
MSVKEQLQRKTPREMYGPEGVLLENKGVESIIRVALDMDYVRRKVQDLGLDMVEKWTIAEWGASFLIGRADRTVESVDVLEDAGEGFVWVADSHVKKFQDLIGIDERAVG